MRPVRASDLDFATYLRPGERVMVGQGTAEPLTLTRRLMRDAERAPACTLFVGPVYSDTFALPVPEHIRFESYGAIGKAARLARAGRLAIYPTHFSVIARDIADGRLPVDCALLQLRPSISGRGYNLGIANDIGYLAARRARCVLVEINRALPACHGGDIGDDLPIAATVEAEDGLLELPSPAFDEVDRQVGSQVASLVPDGATLQLGIGTIPAAVLAALKDHRDLGLHSGAISDGVVDLVECGAMTNALKETDRGVGVAGLLLGTRRLYDHAHLNPHLRLAGPDRTHGLATIAGLSRFHAINSALQVDLTGQVSSETIDGRHVGTVGGQVDFTRGALLSEGGRAIVALRSTNRSGGSNIVPELASVSCSRADADTIVTEHGVAELRGQGLAERARRMIAIAAPEWRETLQRFWNEKTGGAA